MMAPIREQLGYVWAMLAGALIVAFGIWLGFVVCHLLHLR
jgi:hypothetical protein